MMTFEGDELDIEELESIDDILGDDIEEDIKVEEEISVEEEAMDKNLEESVESKNTNRKKKEFKRPFVKFTEVYRYRVVKAQKDISKSVSGGIALIIKKVDDAKYSDLEGVIVPTIELFWGVFKEPITKKVQGHEKTLPTFNWDDENKFWFTDLKSCMEFVNLLKKFLKGEKFEENFQNPAKGKIVFMQAKDKYLSFRLVRNVSDRDKINVSVYFDRGEVMTIYHVLNGVINEIPKTMLQIAIN